jgi:hypothetical protein
MDEIPRALAVTEHLRMGGPPGAQPCSAHGHEPDHPSGRGSDGLPPGAGTQPPSAFQVVPVVDGPDRGAPDGHAERIIGLRSARNRVRLLIIGSHGSHSSRIGGSPLANDIVLCMATSIGTRHHAVVNAVRQTGGVDIKNASKAL